MKLQHAITVCAIKDLAMFVRGKTSAKKHRLSWNIQNLKLGVCELELHRYSQALNQRLDKDGRRAVRFIAALTLWTALVRFALEFCKTVGRRWLTKKDFASWNIIKWFPAELFEI